MDHWGHDALWSTVPDPSILPEWWHQLSSELHRVLDHDEAPAPKRTAELRQMVEAAYDNQRPGLSLDDQLAAQTPPQGAAADRALVDEAIASGRLTVEALDVMREDAKWIGERGVEPIAAPAAASRLAAMVLALTEPEQTRAERPDAG